MNDEVKATPEACLSNRQELNDNSPGLQPGVKVPQKKPVQLQINSSGKHFLNRNARIFSKVEIPRPVRQLADQDTPFDSKGDVCLNKII